MRCVWLPKLEGQCRNRGFEYVQGANEAVVYGPKVQQDRSSADGIGLEFLLAVRHLYLYLGDVLLGYEYASLQGERKKCYLNQVTAHRSGKCNQQIHSIHFFSALSGWLPSPLARSLQCP